MIHEITGDILLSKADAIAHGVAPNDHFDSGLALSLRQDWPAMYKDFRHYCHTSNPEPGTLWVWAGADGRRIVNLFTQEPAPNGHGHPGRASTENVNRCLRELAKVIASFGFKSIALPRLATGVGGLSWDQVQPLIKAHLGSLGTTVQLYTHYEKGVPAKEGV
jgi:O-acetyl-ADP-ribose deacetylase (regulator of RNase III)